MEKPIKIILFIIVGLAVINLISNLFGTSNLKGIKEDLQKAKITADSALGELRYSKEKIDSINADILRFRAYINNIQKTVQANDLEKRLSEEKNRDTINVIKERINNLRQSIDTTQLPDIDIVGTKN